jgi:hypothetical protein
MFLRSEYNSRKHLVVETFNGVKCLDIHAGCQDVPVQPSSKKAFGLSIRMYYIERRLV